MDLIIYIISLVILFSLAPKVSTVPPTESGAIHVDIPLGSNLKLKKEFGAYEKIIKRLGLVR